MLPISGVQRNSSAKLSLKFHRPIFWPISDAVPLDSKALPCSPHHAGCARLSMASLSLHDFTNDVSCRCQPAATTSRPDICLRCATRRNLYPYLASGRTNAKVPG